MSEIYQVRHTERIDGLQVDESMPDFAIAQICDAYEATLINGDRAKYKALTDVGEKVTRACMDLADPNKLNQRPSAVNLRSWHIIRLLKRHLENLPSGHEWPYRLFPIGNDGDWRKDWDKEVVQATDANLKRFIADYSANPQPELASKSETFREDLLLTYEARSLSRQQWVYPIGSEHAGEPHQVAYVIRAL